MSNLQLQQHLEVAPKSVPVPRSSTVCLGFEIALNYLVVFFSLNLFQKKLIYFICICFYLN